VNRELSLIEKIFRGGSPSVAAATALMHTSNGRRMLGLIADELTFTLKLEHDGRIIAHASLRRSARFEAISPGNYVLSLTTGRELWRAHLTAEQLVLPQSRAQRAAAQTSDFEHTPTLRTIVADGALQISAYAGEEAGVLVCELI
jgi:hypothetical protein